MGGGGGGVATIHLKPFACYSKKLERKAFQRNEKLTYLSISLETEIQGQVSKIVIAIVYFSKLIS